MIITFDTRGLTPDEDAVFLEIIQSAYFKITPKGLTYKITPARVKRIAKRCSMSEKRVIGAIQELEKEKELEDEYLDDFPEDML